MTLPSPAPAPPIVQLLPADDDAAVAVAEVERRRGVGADEVALDDVVGAAFGIDAVVRAGGDDVVPHDAVGVGDEDAGVLGIGSVPVTSVPM